MAEIRWTPQALEDIENIAKYIAKDSMKYAAIQVEDFYPEKYLYQNSDTLKMYVISPKK